jgi:hypothetical protein
VGSTDPRRRAREIVERVLPDVASEAAGTVVPGGGAALRAALAALDSFRLAEIIEEAIVQTVLASAELCDDPLLSFRIGDGGVSGSGIYALVPWLTLRQFAEALLEKTFVPEGEPGGPRSWVVSSEVARRWSDVASSIETARRIYNAELGGAYLLPKAGARAVGRTRARLREAIALAGRCSRAASRLGHLDSSGGLPRYVEGARGDLLAASVALMYALEDILAAHAELVAAARSVVPERIDALFAVPNPAVIVAEKARRQRQAAQELLDNARQALIDAGEELNGWRAHSSLRDVANIDLRVTAAATDLRFEEQHAANGWLSLGHAIDSARARLETLTSEVADDLDEHGAALRTRMLSQVNAANNAAQQISTRYRAVEDARIHGKTEGLDVTEIDELCADFHKSARAACDAFDELERSVGIQA